MGKRTKNRKAARTTSEVQQTLPMLSETPAMEEVVRAPRRIPQPPPPIEVAPVVAETEPEPVKIAADELLLNTVVATAKQVAEPVTQPAGSIDAGPCLACAGAWAKLLFVSTDRLYETTSEQFKVVECCSCRLIRLHPLPSPEVLPSYYPPNYWFTPSDGTADRLEQWYRRIVLGDHVRFVHRAIVESKASGTVLDVGCGGGLFLRLLADRFQSSDKDQVALGPFVGLDFSWDAANAAWSHLKVPVTCGTLTSAPIADGSCAALTMFHVLEHLYDPAAYVEAAHRLLKPDGRLIVQVPNAACWQFLLFGERWNGVDVPRHLIDFKTSDLDKLLDACGFEVIRHKYFSLRDNPAGLATTLAVHLDPMSRRLRKVEETDRMRLLKDLAYTGLVFASLPFTILEAACRAGSTIMIEARKKS